MLIRTSLFAALLPLALGACSTALLPESAYDDVEPETDGPLDASVPRDAATDAARPRDAAVPGDASASSSNFPRDCTAALPAAGFATLFTQDCAMRKQLMCTSQSDLDRQLETIATRCGAPRGAILGFTTSAAGCPDQLRYDQASVRGAISFCLQGALEELRFPCANRCGVVRVGGAR